MRAQTASAAPIASTLALAAAGWVVIGLRMRGMDMGPGTDVGSLTFFAGTWTAMMAAMMLPSALPAILVSPRRRASVRASTAFAASYIAVWSAVGLVAFAAYRAIDAAQFGFLAWERGGAYLTAAAVAAAGLYELTPLKRACLGRCRQRVDRTANAVRAGLHYGANCIGCSAGLMLVLLALGVMSFTWMFVVAALLLLEKVPRVGPRFVTPIATLLVALGTWIALDPSSVPGLTLRM